MKNIFTIFMMIALCGCAAAMALGRPSAPNLANIQPGNTNEDVRQAFASFPLETIESFDKKTYTERYTYNAGSGPSIVWGVIHTIFSVATLGFYEYIGIPLELTVFRPRYEMLINYDDKGIIKSIDKIKMGNL